MQLTLPNSDAEILTIPQLLAAKAQQFCDSPCLLASGRRPLSYRQLYDHVVNTVSQLNRLAIGRGDRLLLIAPEGPELTTAVLAIGSGATLMAVSASLSADDYDYLLTKSAACALLIHQGTQSAARDVAKKHELRILELIPHDDLEAGLFSIEAVDGQPLGQPLQELLPPVFAEPEDVFMLVPTSGTTGRPKLVPRIHRAWCVSRESWQNAYQRTSQDVLLNTQSMIYTNGVNFLLGVLWVGGQNVCTTGFDAVKFYDWLDEFHPTFFMGTANNYQAILGQASLHQDSTARSSLQVLCTGFMPMTQQLVEAIETTFKVPVINTYGTTEAMSISMGPLPPLPRKMGSVGKPFGHQVAIFDPEGQSLPTGEIGEIVLRGDKVFSGYEGDLEANTTAFINGWYRTGDLGYLDEDGYLFLTGRIKEIINRGGFKVSPVEVENVLLAHAAVAEVVVFGMPHRNLGEEIAAAIVLHKNASSISERDLQLFVMAHLSEAKTPRRIVFLESLPRTANGKLQRLGMAGRLNLTSNEASSIPTTTAAHHTTALAQQITAIWASVLQRPPETIDVHTAFRDVGGDSLAATRLVFALRQELNIPVTILDLFDATTIKQQAIVIENLQQNGTPTRRSNSLVPLQTNGTQPPVFCFHALEGGIFYYRNVLDHLPPDQPIYGLQAVGMDGTEPPLERIEDMVEHHLQQIRSIQINGPYYLVGYSMGGRLALETARRLRDEFGVEAYVFIVDDLWGKYRDLQMADDLKIPWKRFLHRMKTPIFVLAYLPLYYKWAYLRMAVQRMKKLWSKGEPQPSNSGEMTVDENKVGNDKIRPYGLDVERLPLEVQKVVAVSQKATIQHVLRRYDGPVTFLRAKNLDVNLFRTLRDVNGGRFEFIDIPGSHHFLMQEPTVSLVGNHLRAWLARVQSK